jgi:cellulose synthase/poly-beta-1,6-N-acetylglucosamine synthase-like glycosyltransferase
MTELAVILFWVLLGLVIGQALMTLPFDRALFRWNRGDRGYAPKAAVVLCLRGADPFLPACVEALLKQDYPSYDVKVVVDCREDAAWAVVEEVVDRSGATNVEIVPLTQRRETCSLKCSSVVQAVSRLDASYEVAALVDADTVPHPTWLRELVAPLADPRIGAATGNRWYMPGERSWGALVRYAWNAAAVVQMYLYRIPWGGSLAIRTSVFRDSDLLERWGNAFCEDTMLYRALRKMGLGVAFVPSLMMVNREGCDIPNYFRWVTRQLLTARLYHPHWFGVALHGIATSLGLVVTLGVALVAAATGRWEAAAWAGGGAAVYLAAMPLLLAPMEALVRRIVRGRGEPAGWLTLGGAFKLLAAIGLTQAVYPAALVSAMRVRRVEWRGVSYEIGGPFDIRLVEYRPHRPDASAPSTASL